MRRRRGLGAAAALCLSLIGSALLARIPAYAADLTAQGVSAWSDPQPGFVHVVGEVVNSGAVNYQVQVHCTLVDASGTTLTDTKAIEADILMPTEKAPFDDPFMTGDGYHSPSCSATGAQTAFQPDHNFTAMITAVQLPADGSQHVIGTLTNLNSVADSNIRVMLTSYDPNNTSTVIDEGVATVDGPVAANGGTATFDLNADPQHWDTDPSHSATLSEAPSPAVQLSSDNIPFSDQVQGTVSGEKGLYVRNIGTGDLILSTPTFSANNPADFGLAADDKCSGMTVAPGAYCSMGVTFTPQAVGSRSATLQIDDNANGSPNLVTLSGDGLARPSIAVSAASLEFGSQMVGTTGQTVMQLSSNGLDPASISSIRVDDTTDFGADGSACLVSAMPAGGSCQISVTFHPQFNGPLTGTMTIRSNARQDPVTIALSGTGTHAVPGATLSANQLTFGSQLVGTTSPSQPITLTNSGTGSLTISGVAASGDFAESTTCGATLARGASCNIAVTFAPVGDAGSRQGTVTVTDNAGSGSQIVNLTGTGTLETDFYFAEGFTVPGFQETLVLLMPNHDGTATIDSYTKGGVHATSQVTLMAGQVKTVDVGADPKVANQEVSIRVKLPFPGIAERLLNFNFGSWHGSTDIVGATGPNTEWDFAEGSTLSMFSEYLTLQNPNAVPVPATLTYMTDSGAHPAKTVILVANSRTTVEVFHGDTTSNLGSCTPNGTGSNCGVGPGVGGVSVRVTTPSGQPIVAERPFYVNGFSFGSGPINGGHVAFGANAPARLWYFAEGTTLSGFNEYLTLQNPNSTTIATVTLRYTDQSGTVTTRTVNVNPLSRFTVEVFNTLYGVGPGVTGVSTQVTSTVPIVAERPMYIVRDFGGGPVAGASVVVGSNTLGTLFGFSAASTSSGNSDFLTLQNPSTTSTANVTIDYYTAGGKVTKAVTVNANTRLTVAVSGTTSGVGTGEVILGIVVTSTNAVPILVEKPTYNANASTYGATDTLGYSPPNF